MKARQGARGKGERRGESERREERREERRILLGIEELAIAVEGYIV